jgi:GMP synthase (glutamine-hydrolysing)
MKKRKLNKICILDFGSQTTQLIARKIRGLGVYAEIVPFNIKASQIDKETVKGIVFSGGPESIYKKNSPRPDPLIYQKGIPVLGICYGLQLITNHFGGEITAGEKKKEYGEASLDLKKEKDQEPFLTGVKKSSCVWMSHGDEAKKIPFGFKVLGATKNSPSAIFSDKRRGFYAVQFHPEVSQTKEGGKLLANFVFNICACSLDWLAGDIVNNLTEEAREIAAGRNVLEGVSGGVDSTVMAVLLHRALGKKLRCLLVDTGFLRKNEIEVIKKRFNHFLKFPVEVRDASSSFLTQVGREIDGQVRRKIIGREYIKLFLSEMGPKDVLAQGTLYPDVIESAAEVSGPAHTIKTHHNRVKEVLDLMEEGRVLEIFKGLFKDEVRAIGRELGLPLEIIARQPFPGPGLAIRILGEITTDRLETLRDADAIVIEELKKADLYFKIAQTVVALDAHQATCVKGDAKGSGYLILVKNVQTLDFMTTEAFDLGFDLRKKITTRILNEVKGAGRVLFDESNKPPATICYL